MSPHNGHTMIVREPGNCAGYEFVKDPAHRLPSSISFAFMNKFVENFMVNTCRNRNYFIY